MILVKKFIFIILNDETCQCQSLKQQTKKSRFISFFAQSPQNNNALYNKYRFHNICFLCKRFVHLFLSCYTFIAIRKYSGQTTATPNYYCNVNDNEIRLVFSTSSHSAWESASNCSLQQCNRNSGMNNNCYFSEMSCYDYRTLNNVSYCTPAVDCSLLEPCINTTYTCASSQSVCIVNTCCSTYAVCLPLLLLNICPPSKNRF